MCYTTPYDAPSYYPEALKFNSAPSYINKEVKYYTVVSKYYTAQVLECYTTTYAAPAYYI